MRQDDWAVGCREVHTHQTAMAMGDSAAEDAARSRLCVDQDGYSTVLADDRELENVCCPSAVLDLAYQDEHREHHGY
jgi:hypothetical protein